MSNGAKFLDVFARWLTWAPCHNTLLLLGSFIICQSVCVIPPRSQTSPISINKAKFTKHRRRLRSLLRPRTLSRALMKYGRHLKAAAVEGWEYLDYKGLKKLLKRLGAGSSEAAEKQFMRASPATIVRCRQMTDRVPSVSAQG